MPRIDHSQRAVIFKIACLVSSLGAFAGIIVSLRSGHDLAVLASLLGVAVATASAVEAYWSGVAARRLE